MNSLIPSALSREKVDIVQMVTKLIKETNVANIFCNNVLDFNGVLLYFHDSSCLHIMIHYTLLV